MANNVIFLWKAGVPAQYLETSKILTGNLPDVNEPRAGDCVAGCAAWKSIY